MLCYVCLYTSVSQCCVMFAFTLACLNVVLCVSLLVLLYRSVHYFVVYLKYFLKCILYMVGKDVMNKETRIWKKRLWLLSWNIQSVALSRRAPTICDLISHVRWVPVTTAWRVLRLRMEERPPIWRVTANKLNKQSRRADEAWSSSLGVGRGANNASPWKPMLRITH